MLIMARQAPLRSWVRSQGSWISGTGVFETLAMLLAISECEQGVEHWCGERQKVIDLSVPNGHVAAPQLGYEPPDYIAIR